MNNDDDFTAYYLEEDDSVKSKQRDCDFGSVAQIDPHRFKKSKGGGGGGTLGGKESEDESVSVTAPTSSLKRRLDDLLPEDTTTIDRPPISGFLLMEVLSVDIKDNNNQGGCVSLYGTIRIKDALPAVCIYNTQRKDSKSISLTGDTTASLLLTGPPRTIGINCDLLIHLALMHKKKDDTDAVFYKGAMHWNIYEGIIETFDEDEWGDLTSEVVFKPSSNAFGQILATIFNGKSGGSVTINYIMLGQGIGANVEVTLLKHGGGHHGGAAAHVYGLIRAGSNCGNVSYGSLLLQKKKENDEHIDVHPGHVIPLSRSLVAVNRTSSLKVSVELYDRLRDTDFSQDDEIVKGNVVFPPQISGTSEQIISGRYGEIQVKVSWCL